MVHGRTVRLMLCLLVPTIIGNAAFSQPPANQNAADFDPLYRLTQKKGRFQLVEKFSKIIQTESKIVEARDFDADVISVSPLDVNRLRVQALKPGVTTINILDENNDVYSVEVFVTGDVRHLQAYLSQLFPSSSVSAIEVQESVVLRGWVTQPEHITEMMEIAEQFYPRVLNQMKVGGVQQVMMKVKIIEVSRSKVRQMGFNFLAAGENGFLASTPGALSPVSFGDMGELVSSIGDSTVSFGVIDNGNTFNGFLEALKEERLAKVKAEPTLVTTNGRPAKLLNGGEFPILVPQGLGTATIQWREFGVNMEAVPIILGNGRLRLELQPEVSERNFQNAVELNGLVVPALTTRRVNTQVEMKFGQTLMIAGLINRTETGTASKIPWIGEYPVIGSLFSRKRYEENETELLVMVTPEYVSPLDANDPIPLGPGEDTTTPTDRELYLDGLLEVPKYGNADEYCPPSPMSHHHHSPYAMPPNTIPSSPYMMPPAEMSPETSQQLNPKLPPAPAIEAENTDEAAPIQSQVQPSRKSAAPFPASDFWSQGTDTVDTWAPSNYSGDDLQQVEYNSQAEVDTSRSGRGWSSRK